MKLLFTQDALVNAGAERSHLEILSRFSEEIDVSLVYFYPKHDLKAEYEKAGIRLIFLDIPESYHFPLAVSRLVKLIRSEKPDLLVSSLWRADQITRIASLITRVPLIGTLVNDSYSPIAWKDKKGLKHKGVYWLDRITAGIPVHWIANAQALADSHVKTLGLDASKVSVVYRGRIVPEGAWESKPSPRSVFPQTEIPAPKTLDDFQFLSYGRLLERKGFQDAILAFSLILEKYPNCTLTIYGEGPFRFQLESLIKELKLQEQVKLPGKVSNPAALLLTANCFLFPSWYEGFSGALVEAMMAGIPIIASDIPMNLEAVEDSKSALTFPVTKVNILADTMIYAIRNPEKMSQLGFEARKRAIELFSIDQIAQDYECTIKEIYKSLA
ncbi:glycosyltransferase [Algoriphagus antarcticus]|uniref:Glycosyltransferase involved in cell wall biosynthesis n=1 Tax=Algoriphagus antarcticus TaxID=238540 RepID=A0A3E0E012_9BACT|nr:glycosyltransferase [Algoriphagus antarcticus]REG91525.1 glycosyltransferase involved in cell wall biosynthesis [Algoriphagus antarcticus]